MLSVNDVTDMSTIVRNQSASLDMDRESVPLIPHSDHEHPCGADNRPDQAVDE